MIGGLRALLLGLLLIAIAGPARAAEPLSQFNVMLLQPSAVLEQRVPSVDAMAAYIKAIEAAAREAVLASETRQAVAGFIVVAVRPGPQSRVWLDFDGLTDLGLQRRLTERIQAVPPFEARQGPVVFALKLATWGARASKRMAPSPQAWKQAAPAGGGAPLEVGELVERLWAD